MRKLRKILLTMLLVLAAATVATNAAAGNCWHCRWDWGVGWYCDPNGVSGEQGWIYCDVKDAQCVHGNDICYAK